jgi:hypothetical protein
MLRSEVTEFLERAREKRPFGIGQIHLVPMPDDRRMHARREALR